MDHLLPNALRSAGSCMNWEFQWLEQNKKNIFAHTIISLILDHLSPARQGSGQGEQHDKNILLW